MSTTVRQPAPPLAGKSIYVVDTHALIFQVFHALPEMTSPKGEPVNAIFGLARDLFFLIEQKQPDYLFCAFDAPGPTFRHEMYDQYKIERAEMPSDLAQQMARIRELVTGFRIPILEQPGFEADDILATLARQCHDAQGTCRLVTNDKDCRQLITEYVQLYNIRKDEPYDRQALWGDWGISPEQVVDFQALVGDKIDNVPGVPLIGPKIAQQLLEAHQSLESVLDNADSVSGKKRRENLIAYREQALLSRQLARLDADLQIDIDWNAATVGEWDDQALDDLFDACGFRSLREKLTPGGLFGGIAEKDTWEADYQLVTSLNDLKELVAEFQQHELISVDTETTHISPRWAELVGISMACEPGKGYYVPVRGPVGSDLLPWEQSRELLSPLLENPNVGKVGQNLKYDLVVLKEAGIEVRGVEFDTMLASYLLDSGGRNHGLNALSERLLGHKPIPISDLIGTGKQQKRMDDVPVDEVADYAAEDADIPLRLTPILKERLQESELDQLNQEVEVPLVGVLASMEHTGIAVDRDRLAELSSQFGEKVQILAEEIEDLAGHPLNISSPKQLAVVLFSELGLPIVKRTKTGPSTDAEVLDQLAEIHPLPAKIIEYRQFTKLKNTYVDTLPELIHPQTGRVHASFNQVVAATGRLSCGDPNLQNIPVRTEEGRQIRSAFFAGEDGWKLIAADYSQIELRVLAHFSGDDTLCEAFAKDADIHTLVASQVNGVDLQEVTPEMRRKAKAVNFGVIYGQSAFGLAKSLKIPKDDAAAFIEAYFARYPGVEEFMAGTLKECHHDGYSKTILGRRRYIEGIRSEVAKASPGNRKLRQLNMAERTAVNSVIQGSAADLIKLAMIRVYDRLRHEQLQTRLLLQIHDELILEGPEAEVDQAVKLIVEEMTSAMDLVVPLKVDVKTGKNWAECEAYS